MKFELPKNFTIPKIDKLSMPKMDKLNLPKIDTKNLPKGMAIDMRMSEVSRYFSGSVFEKAVMALDKASLWIIGITWLAALLGTGAAFLAVKNVAALRVQTEAARAMEPPVPHISRAPLSKEQYDPLVERVKKQFPGLTYEVTNKPSLHISSSNGENFNSWLNAIGYTDSLVPTVRWNLTQFCAGSECPGQGLMQAELVAETITISQAEGGGAIPASTPPSTPSATPAPK